MSLNKFSQKHPPRALFVLLEMFFFDLAGL